MKSVVALLFSSAFAADASTCSVKHDTAMSAQFYSNTRISQSACCDLCASDDRCATAVYSPFGECHLHDATDSHVPFSLHGWMLMTVTPAAADIVKIAEGNADLSTLVSALTAGKLVNTLEGKGPFTVFAPTNEAFARIPKNLLNQVLANVTLLDQLLEYHVLSGSFAAKDLLAAKAKTTLEKEDVAIRTIGGKVLVNNAEVTAADVKASNGIVHVVDNVLVPPDFPVAPYTEDIVELAESQPDLSTLVAALVAGKLTETLSGTGPFTVFAPTNEAFAKIPAADLQKLLADTKALDKVLEYHVLAGTFKMQELMAAKSIATLEGDAVSVSETGNVINVNDANVLKFDVAATNGIVHVIDTVLSVPTETVV